MARRTPGIGLMNFAVFFYIKLRILFHNFTNPLILFIILRQNMEKIYFVNYLVFRIDADKYSGLIGYGIGGAWMKPQKIIEIPIPEWSYSTATALLKALQEKDPYTFGHCLRVGYYTRLLAESIGLNPFECKLAEFTGIFHDIGKIGIPDQILKKPDNLTEIERAIIKTHPIKSEGILKPLGHIPFFATLLKGIRHHHERLDGKGYPDGLQDEEIPLMSRIVLVTDTFDAVTTSRSYHDAQPAEVAYQELLRHAGKQFDEDIVMVFLENHPKWAPVEQDIPEEKIQDFLPKAA